MTASAHFRNRSLGNRPRIVFSVAVVLVVVGLLALVTSGGDDGETSGAGQPGPAEGSATPPNTYQTADGAQAVTIAECEATAGGTVMVMGDALQCRVWPPDGSGVTWLPMVESTTTTLSPLQDYDQRRQRCLHAGGNWVEDDDGDDKWVDDGRCEQVSASPTTDDGDPRDNLSKAEDVEQDDAVATTEAVRGGAATQRQPTVDWIDPEIPLVAGMYDVSQLYWDLGGDEAALDDSVEALSALTGWAWNHDMLFALAASGCQDWEWLPGDEFLGFSDQGKADWAEAISRVIGIDAAGARVAIDNQDLWAVQPPCG